MRTAHAAHAGSIRRRRSTASAIIVEQVCPGTIDGESFNEVLIGTARGINDARRLAIAIWAEGATVPTKMARRSAWFGVVIHIARVRPRCDGARCAFLAIS